MVCIAAVHSTTLGPALGGCRMWHYADTRAAVADALRLSRGMTFKSAVAGNPLGGGKGVIALPDPGPLDEARRRDVLLDFGEVVDQLQGAYVTAEDVGTSTADMAVIAERTEHVTGLAGGSGDPSPWTALGVVAAMREACARTFGTPDLADRSVSVIGLGHVGLRIAELLAADGAELLAYDVVPDRRADAERLGARWVDADTARTAAVDVLCPCALGGLLDEQTVPDVRAPLVVGAANNQLADDSIAGLLVERGITWVPDFVANAGGIINIAVELEPAGYDSAVAQDRVLGIGRTAGAVLDRAVAERTTTLDAAMALAVARLRA